MKKIAILTQPLKTNYGGILQNFALQKVLISLGYSPITIDRHYIKHPRLKLMLSRLKRRVINTIKGTEQKMFSNKDLRYISQNSTNFIEKHIVRTQQVSTTEELIKHFKANIYSTIIVGSDQTWRPMYSPNIYNYFLDFLEANSKIKKISYAASFGTDQWEFTEEQALKSKELISLFDAISVREDSGIKLCENYLNTESELVLDPTLLLSIDDYIATFKDDYPSFIPYNKGLYTYVLDRDNEKELIIENLEKELNLKEYRSQPKVSLMHPISNDVNDYVYPKVEEWIRGFYTADFVITDSFHGTVFSILFNKPFIAIANKERGASRFTSLLKQLGLEDRLIYTMEDLKATEIYKNQIEYSEVNKKLKFLKEKSLMFLKNNLK